MDTEKFTHWQQRTIEQLGFSINLILTLALGALGYLLAKYDKTNTARLSKYTFVITSILLLLALLFGIVASITRLYDFRFTARIIRQQSEVERDRLRAITDRLGSCTWFFFWAETVAFALGVCATAILALSEKL